MSDQNVVDFVLSRSRTFRGVVPILVPIGLSYCRAVRL
jgi:hypothetical protein